MLNVVFAALQLKDTLQITISQCVPRWQKGHELFLLVSSHVLMQSLWTVCEQPSGWRCSGSTRFRHIRHSLRVSTMNPCGGGGCGCGAGPNPITGLGPSFFASLSPTCTTTSSVDMPASVPRELFTCRSSDFSWALVHSGKRLASFSKTFSSLSAGASAALAACVEGAGGGVMLGGGVA